MNGNIQGYVTVPVSPDEADFEMGGKPVDVVDCCAGLDSACWTEARIRKPGR